MFAEPFGAGAVAWVMGGLHDIGKMSEAYQRYIRTLRDDGMKTRGPDHSSAGAKEADKLYGVIGRIMAFGIAGHHGGLMDGTNLTERR